MMGGCLLGAWVVIGMNTVHVVYKNVNNLSTLQRYKHFQSISSQLVKMLQKPKIGTWFQKGCQPPKTGRPTWPAVNRLVIIKITECTHVYCACDLYNLTFIDSLQKYDMHG